MLARELADASGQLSDLLLELGPALALLGEVRHLQLERRHVLELAPACLDLGPSGLELLDRLDACVTLAGELSLRPRDRGLGLPDASLGLDVLVLRGRALF